MRETTRQRLLLRAAKLWRADEAGQDGLQTWSGRQNRILSVLRSSSGHRFRSVSSRGASFRTNAGAVLCEIHRGGGPKPFRPGHSFTARLGTAALQYRPPGRVFWGTTLSGLRYCSALRTFWVALRLWPTIYGYRNVSSPTGWMAGSQSHGTFPCERSSSWCRFCSPSCSP